MAVDQALRSMDNADLAAGAARIMVISPPGHCPPQATFIHRLSDGRTRQLRIHYPAEDSPS